MMAQLNIFVVIGEVLKKSLSMQVTQDMGLRRAPFLKSLRHFLMRRVSKRFHSLNIYCRPTGCLTCAKGNIENHTEVMIMALEIHLVEKTDT